VCQVDGCEDLGKVEGREAAAGRWMTKLAGCQDRIRVSNADVKQRQTKRPDWNQGHSSGKTPPGGSWVEALEARFTQHLGVHRNQPRIAKRIRRRGAA